MKSEVTVSAGKTGTDIFNTHSSYGRLGFKMFYSSYVWYLFSRITWIPRVLMIFLVYSWFTGTDTGNDARTT